MPKHSDRIRLRGVCQNNLKGFDLDLPVGKLTVVTGLSGAGKSSLVFETLHAEGQRRYVETFSPYTRQFMELLDRPEVESVENIRPSIAIRQSNTVKTSRSTVGTLTELTDYFKVWFANVATLYDPATGKPVADDNPQSVWKALLKRLRGETVLIAFEIVKPARLDWEEILASLSSQGFTRIVHDGKVVRIREPAKPVGSRLPGRLLVIQDRVSIESGNRTRLIDACCQAFAFGKGRIEILDAKGNRIDVFSQGLRSPETGEQFRPASPALFSFNSPVGACPKCRGFGRILEIYYRLVIPDHSLPIDNGAIRAFQGQVYGESLRDLQRAAQKHKVRTHVPWAKLNEKERRFVMEGEPRYAPDRKRWYGLHRFFDWLEGNLYKMHVRVFLSKFRGHTLCPECGGDRLRPVASNWKWRGHTLPELYRKSVSELLALFTARTSFPKGRKAGAEADAALSGILSRLGFIEQVGLGYLTLDRSSRTLSGGETMRVNLTSCLGSSLVDTLFVLDEPSVGLHPRDMERLIAILRRLTDLGNTVVVVEHDEAVMRAADHLVEIGPDPGVNGGRLVFQGDYEGILKTDTHTGRFLSGRDDIPIPRKRRALSDKDSLFIEGATQHNLVDLDVVVPLRRFVCLSGVSGAGKSTLLNDVIYQNMPADKGRVVSTPAAVKRIHPTVPFSDIVRIDQSPISKTPRSNPASYSDAWSTIRKVFARQETALKAGMEAGHFSFNSGDGRCSACSGLGYERIDMQFVSDIFVSCETCRGRRFRDEVLEIRCNGRSIADILDLDIDKAVLFFGNHPKIVDALRPLADVGLGYLKLGQPLNTLSGGESQRLKLVNHLGKVNDKNRHALILIDEPTTGLHRADVKRLVEVFQNLVDAGHSLIVIEHNLDILKVADWIIELGPEAGKDGQVIAQGTPEDIARSPCETAAYLSEVLGETHSAPLRIAEDPTAYKPQSSTNGVLAIRGAREHNLKNISAEIPHKKMTVVTGVSGSGKSSLAFDIVFAEGRRRFMESMSAYARQFVEQMPRADVDDLRGIAPTVAIEQRVTKGTRKSTVATVTEVAQYIRLLYARIGIQHAPTTGQAVIGQSEATLLKRLKTLLENTKAKSIYLCAPLVVGRKGHYEPLANWARDRGYKRLRIDGRLIEIAGFKKLDRYKEHDIDLVVANLSEKETSVSAALKESLRLGKGTAFLLSGKGKVLSLLSTRRTDPITGEAFPELEPKHFSWNSPRGWCPTCRGYGRIFHRMADKDFDEEDAFDRLDDFEHGELCPDCQGDRLNAISRAVRLPLRQSGGKAKASEIGGTVSLPELLKRTPVQLLATLKRIKVNRRSGPILKELLPEIEERMQFMDRVGLGYLGLDRATATLSGGEAQRIRLAAQLGSNLSGVLYVLDEPSIGLHARDNEKLIESLKRLRERGNTLLVVEHDEATMRHADKIIDLGPAAGVHGGEIVAEGTLAQLKRNRQSVTGKYLRQRLRHPLRGNYRELPAPWSLRKKKSNKNWIHLEGAALRNLKGFDVGIPKQRLTVVCGVSGTGKSTLTRDLLKPLVEAAVETKKSTLHPKDLTTDTVAGSNELKVAQAIRFSKSDLGSSTFRSLSNADSMGKVIEVDQSPIGKTPRSTPATYIGAFDIVRDIYASLPEARLRGYTGGTFSFNTKGGRCETCKGAGRVKLEMHFMPDTYVTCEDCDGRRYGAELDEIRWNGKNIADVLAMSFQEAALFFSFHSKLTGLMKLMVEAGLGYIALGQYSPTLSGGEAQRMKLVGELAKGQPTLSKTDPHRSRGHLYILEEPTIGLHFGDVERLSELLHRLVDRGHTVIVVEHHLDLIAEADYLIEIGPDGGDAGGELLYQGTIAGLKKSKRSVTAQFL